MNSTELKCQEHNKKITLICADEDCDKKFLCIFCKQKHRLVLELPKRKQTQSHAIFFRRIERRFFCRRDIH